MRDYSSKRFSIKRLKTMSTYRRLLYEVLLASSMVPRSPSVAIMEHFQSFRRNPKFSTFSNSCENVIEYKTIEDSVEGASVQECLVNDCMIRLIPIQMDSTMTVSEDVKEGQSAGQEVGMASRNYWEPGSHHVRPASDTPFITKPAHQHNLDPGKEDYSDIKSEYAKKSHSIEYAGMKSTGTDAEAGGHHEVIPTQMPSSSQPTQQLCTGKNALSDNRDVREVSAIETERNTLDSAECIKVFIPRKSLVSVRKLKRKFRRFGKVEAVEQDQNSCIRHVLYIQPNPDLQFSDEADNGIMDDYYWLSASESETDVETSSNECDVDPNPEFDRSQCIQLFIPVNSVIKIKAAKKQFRQFGKVEVVPQDCASGIKHILYIQPSQIQNVHRAADQIAIRKKPSAKVTKSVRFECTAEPAPNVKHERPLIESSVEPPKISPSIIQSSGRGLPGDERPGPSTLPEAPKPALPGGVSPGGTQPKLTALTENIPR
ncbi:hypothetical protein Aperf_G00000028173 [Anoplocephala perfoliata]